MTDDQSPPEFSKQADDASFDDATFDDATAAARYDAEPFTEVTAALADLSFLHPDRAPEPPETMPAPVWDRLSAALDAEAAARAVDAHENVLAFPAAAAASSGSAAAVASPEPRSRALRWAGGLVAASVAVVAVGVGVTVVRDKGSGGAVVAGDAPVIVTASAVGKSVAPQELTAAAAEAAPAAPSAFSAPQSDAVTEPSSSPSVGVVPAEPTSAAPQLRSGDTLVQPVAAKMVMATGTNYVPENLQAQVIDLLDTVGADTPEQAAALPVDPPEAWPVGTGGFTTSMATLRDCITALTQSAKMQALVVDHSTYSGADAGVVVAPAVYRRDPATPSPTASIDTDMGRLDVWVVNPDCSTVDRKVLQYLLDQWRG